jgi:holo-[acyl-carrier protein] synthase
MIIGVGIDIAELDRIQSSLERFGDKFSARILTPDEQSRMPANAVPYVASRFAAKEAAVKALGTGFSQGITFRDIEVRSDALGKPGIIFHGEARRRADEMGACAVHLSLTHGRDNAVAVVILETFPTS